jgi:ABC-type dipeptide/oligopeptide/nickel transport system permease component
MTILPYIGRRLLWSLPTLIGALVVVFFLTQAVPGNAAMARVGQFVDPVTLAQVKKNMGIDQPLPAQFLTYVTNLSHGNLGFSWKTGNPVNADLAQRLPATLELAFWTLLLAVPIGTFLGVIAAAYRGSWLDRAIQAYAVLGLGIPVFWLSLMCVYVFFFVFGWVAAPEGRLGVLDTTPPPVTGLYIIDSLLVGDFETFSSAVSHLILPVVSLVLVVAAPIALLTYDVMCRELSSDYARAAIAAGLPRQLIVGRYAMKNAMIPVVTMVGVSVRNLIAGAVLTEIVFAWPGIGRYAIESMLVADLAPVQAVVLIVTVFTIIVNLLVDVSYFWFDPRLGVS